MLLQQCLPFTVLKLEAGEAVARVSCEVATVLTVYGIETGILPLFYLIISERCNSAYRLRY